MNLLKQVTRSENVDAVDYVVEVQLARSRESEEEATSAEQSGQEDSVVDAMNRIASGANGRPRKPRFNTTQDPSEAQQSKTRRSPRKRKSDEPIPASPSKRFKSGSAQESRTTGFAEEPNQSSARGQPRPRGSGLKMRPIRDRSIPDRSSQDLGLPDHGEQEIQHLRPARVHFGNSRDKRTLVQRANTKSPLKGRGVVRTDVPGVNLEENVSPPRPREQLPSRAKRQRKRSPPAEGVSTKRQQEKDQTIAAPGGQQDPNDDRQGSHDDQAHEDDSEGTLDEDARREAEERAEQRRKALNGIEQAATLFGRKEAWIELFIAGRAIRVKQKSPQPESESGERALMHIKQIKSLFTASRTESDTPIDLQTIRKPYKKHCRRYHADLEAFKPDSLDTSHERVAQSRDLHQHLIPMLIKACKAALQTLFQGTQPAWAEFDLLAGLLMTTARSVDKAQDWRPRPTTMDNGTLGDMRNKVGKNIRNLHNLFADQAKALRARIDEEELLKKLHRLQAENQARFWQGIRERRARILGRHRRAENGREPLVDITDQVIDIDDSNLDGNQHSTLTSQSTAVRPTRVWSEPETHALLIGLQQCAGPDALRKIDDLKYQELAEISIEDMRQRLQVLKETLRGVEAARENPYLRHVVSFQD